MSLEKKSNRKELKDFISLGFNILVTSFFFQELFGVLFNKSGENICAWFVIVQNRQNRIEENCENCENCEMKKQFGFVFQVASVSFTMMDFVTLTKVFKYFYKLPFFNYKRMLSEFQHNFHHKQINSKS